MKKLLKSAVTVMLAVIMVLGGAPSGALAGLTEWFGGLNVAASATDGVGIQIYNGHYYEVFNINKTWEEAKAYCEALGGYLSTITSQNENNFIVTLLESFSTGYYYIGGSDREQEGNWKWITGEEFDYSNWDSVQDQEPNNGGGTGAQDYCAIYGKGTSSLNAIGCWDDAWGNSRDINHGFICEWDDYAPFNDANAEDFIKFIYNVSTITDEMKNQGNLYNFLTGRIEKNSLEEYYAKVAFLEIAYNNIGATIGQSNYRCSITMNNIISYLEGYVEGKSVYGELMPNTVNEVIDQCVDEIANSAAGYFGVSTKFLDDIRLVKNTYGQIVGLPDKIKKFVDSMVFAVNGMFYLGSESIRACYTYFDQYLQSRSTADFNDSIYAVVDWAMGYEYAPILKVAEWLGLTHENLKVTIESFAEFTYAVEKSLSYSNGYSCGSGNTSQASELTNQISNENPIEQTIEDNRYSGSHDSPQINTVSSYTVVFDSNTDEVDNISVTIVEGETAHAPLMSRTGYKFMGWFLNSECTDEWDGNVNGNMRVYAKWLKICTITLRSNCTAIGNVSINVLEGFNVNFGNSNKFSLAGMNLQRDGYVFMGWYSDASFNNAFYGSITVENDISVYAKWFSLYSIYSVDENNIAIRSIKGYTNTNVVIPNTIDGLNVVSIADGAFKNAGWLTSITLPDSINNIGSHAFRGCSNLESIEFNNNNISIGDYAFAECKKLSNFDFSGVQSIGAYAFLNCKALQAVSLGSTVKDICDFAFAYCSLVQYVNISNSVESLGQFTFLSCGNLSGIYVQSGNLAYADVEGVLFNADKTTLICYPSERGAEYTIPETVLQIKAYAFYGCSSINHLTLPSSVTTIGASAFENCSGMTQIVIPFEVTNIGKNVFAGCNNSVLIKCYNNSVALTYATDNSLSYEVFSVPLESLVLDRASAIIAKGNTLTLEKVLEPIYSNETFSWSSSNTKVATVSAEGTITGLRAGITTVVLTASGGFTSTCEVRVLSFSGADETDYDYQLINDGTAVEILFYSDINPDIAIPSRLGGIPVTSVNSGAFQGNAIITSVTIPDSVSIIETSAFRGCTALESVSLGNNTLSLKDGCFNGCTSLSSIYIPVSVTSVSPNAFTGASSLTEIEVDPLNTAYASIDGVLFSHDETTLVTYPQGKTGQYIIPSSVTSIGSYAFYGCVNISSITIHENINTVGASSFYNCTNLTSVSMTEGLLTIGAGAFSGCSSIAAITIPSTVTSIGSSAFAYCSNIKSLELIDGLTTIGHDAFYGCSSLEDIIIPDTVTRIFEYAFASCTGLKSLIIGKQVNIIDQYAFKNCSGLQTVHFNAVSCSKMGSTSFLTYPAFYNCSALKSVYIGDEVTSIPKKAFYGCSGLTSLTIPESVTTIGTDITQNCPNVTIRCFENSAAHTYAISKNIPYELIHRIRISSENSLIVVGNTLQLSPDVTPASLAVQGVTWLSENTVVATVDQNGLVTGKATGNVRIIGTTADGSTAAAYTVQVKPFVATVIVNSYSGGYSQKVDWWKSYSTAKMSLYYTAYNCDAIVRYEWSSSNAKVKVNQSGNITNTGSFARSATITLTAYDAEENIVAKNSVKVSFYKFSWQKSKVQSRSVLSDNLFGQNLTAQELEKVEIERIENPTLDWMYTVFDWLSYVFTLLWNPLSI